MTADRPGCSSSLRCRRSTWTAAPGQAGIAATKESGGERAWPLIMTWCPDKRAVNNSVKSAKHLCPCPWIAWVISRTRGAVLGMPGCSRGRRCAKRGRGLRGLRLAGLLRIISSNSAEGAFVSDTGGVVGRDRELATVTAFLDALPSGTSVPAAGGCSRDRQDHGLGGRCGGRRRAFLPHLVEPPGRIRGNAVVRGARGPDGRGPRPGASPAAAAPAAGSGGGAADGGSGGQPAGTTSRLPRLPRCDPPPVRFRAGGYRDRRPAVARPSERGGAGVRAAAARERAGRAAGVGPDPGRRARRVRGRSRPACRAPRAPASRSLDRARFRGGTAGVGRCPAFPADTAQAFRRLGR